MKIELDIPELHHQFQPNGVTCVHACLAMALSVPVDDVISKYGDSSITLEDFYLLLGECRLIYTPLFNNTLFIPGWYFLSVPSLNIVGGMHKILVRLDDSCEFHILDPSPKRSYSSGDYKLLSWSNPIYFIPGGRLPLSY